MATNLQIHGGNNLGNNLQIYGTHRILHGTLLQIHGDRGNRLLHRINGGGTRSMGGIGIDWH